PERKKKAARRSAVAHEVSDTDDVTLTKAELDLLAALREKRREIARKESVPAYIVFSDRTLAEMALKRPASLVALSSVRGVGAMKLDKYGPQFLAVLQQAERAGEPAPTAA